MSRIVLAPSRRYPNAPTIGETIESHTAALQQIVESLNIHERRITNSMRDSFVRVSDLEDLDLVEVNGTVVSASTSSTGSGTDVTLAGQDYLTLSGQEITANKIAVDDLADGTDGELITWSATGVPTTVPAGTATYVLTSNGAGAAPTFQANAASVAGSDGQIQYNNSGAFGASSNLSWDNTNATLDINSSTADPHPAIGIQVGDNTGKPVIEIKNSLPSSTVVLKSWEYTNTTNLEVNHRHDLSNKNLTFNLHGTQVLYLDMSGHPKVYQTVTGAGLERILTTSDLASQGFTVAAGNTATWAASSNFVSQSGATATYNSGSTTKFDDNANLTFGTGSDVNIDFDGTNFVVNGVGEAQFNNFDEVTIDGDRVTPITAMSIIGATPGSLSNVNTVQAAFPSDRDVITLPAGTYRMTGSYAMQGGGANRSVGMSFLLTTAVADVFTYRTTAWRDAATTRSTTQSTRRVSTTANTQVTASSTAAAAVIEFDGIVRLTTGGTITPRITFSTAPGGTNTMRPGSYIMFERLGDSTFTNMPSSA